MKDTIKNIYDKMMSESVTVSTAYADGTHIDLSTLLSSMEKEIVLVIVKPGFERFNTRVLTMFSSNGWELVRKGEAQLTDRQAGDIFKTLTWDDEDKAMLVRQLTTVCSGTTQTDKKGPCSAFLFFSVPERSHLLSVSQMKVQMKTKFSVKYGNKEDVANDAVLVLYNLGRREEGTETEFNKTFIRTANLFFDL